MDLRFWGTRGSIACASSGYAQFGGHTSCVSLCVDQRLIIFDAGSGLYDLGVWIQESTDNIRQADLFLSHFHFDHVMGLPFFGPLWNPDFSLTLHYASANPADHQLDSFVKHRLFAPPFFPVPFEKVPSRIDFKEHPLGTPFLLKNQILMKAQPLNHPGGAVGYRVESGDKIISYVTDTEHKVDQPDANVLDLMEQADLVIYDATYTDEEFPQKEGWGHSTWQEGLRLAQAAGVKQLAFFHHAPSHTDDMLTIFEQQAQQTWPSCFMAKQGMKLQL